MHAPLASAASRLNGQVRRWGDGKVRGERNPRPASNWPRRRRSGGQQAERSRSPWKEGRLRTPCRNIARPSVCDDQAPAPSLLPQRQIGLQLRSQRPATRDCTNYRLRACVVRRHRHDREGRNGGHRRTKTILPTPERTTNRPARAAALPSIASVWSNARAFSSKISQHGRRSLRGNPFSAKQNLPPWEDSSRLPTGRIGTPAVPDRRRRALMNHVRAVALYPQLY